jgi:hypothetical protein
MIGGMPVERKLSLKVSDSILDIFPVRLESSPFFTQIR